MKRRPRSPTRTYTLLPDTTLFRAYGCPSPGASIAPPPRPLWGARPTILMARTGQRDVVTAACPLALDLGLAPGMAAAHARALVTDLDVYEAAPEADRAWLDRLALHAVRHWTDRKSTRLNSSH